MKLTDTHCHLYLDSYQGALDQVLERARRAGITRILVPAIDLATSREVLSLIDGEEMLYGAVGVHPNSAESWNDSDLEVLQDMAGHPKVVAVGEIGLDYYRDRTPAEYQKEILLKQLLLAADCQLPVVLHVRNGSAGDRSCIEDLMEILEKWLQEQGPKDDASRRSPGVLHSFSGNPTEAERALRNGFFLGITGPITYKNSEEMREVVRTSGPSRLLVETDGPFLPPQDFRGKRNEPAHVRYIIDKIGEVVGLPSQRIADITSENAANLFTWE